MRADRFSEKIAIQSSRFIQRRKSYGFFNQAILVITKSKLKIADKENLKKASTTKLLENTYVELLKKHKITELRPACRLLKSSAQILKKNETVPTPRLQQMSQRKSELLCGKTTIIQHERDLQLSPHFIHIGLVFRF